MGEKIVNHGDLEVYRTAFDLAMRIFEVSKQFPKEETYALTDRIRRASRSVCANLAEAWRKRRYEAAFIAKLSDSEAEVAATQSWLEFAMGSGYLSIETGRELHQSYNGVIRTMVGMINHSESWILTPRRARE